jgi:hypothetical protein
VRLGLVDVARTLSARLEARRQPAAVVDLDRRQTAQQILDEVARGRAMLGAPH